MSDTDLTSDTGWGDSSIPPSPVVDGGLAEQELEAFVEAAGARIQQEVAEIHARVADHVQNLQSLSERETLAIGRVLSTIVERAQCIITESEDELRRSGEAVEGMTEQLLEQLETEATAQKAAVEKVFTIAEGIGKSVEAIDDLRHSTEMLAINSKIEAARLGEQGRPFAVLAEQMRDLGESVRKTTESVNGAIESVREDLPLIAEHTNAMSTAMQSYIEDMQGHLQQLQGMDTDEDEQGNSLDEIVELSNQALSHLQFQDPLVQQLASIERDVGEIPERVGAALKGEQPQEGVQRSDTNDTNSDDGPAASGDIMLF